MTWFRKVRFTSRSICRCPWRRAGPASSFSVGRTGGEEPRQGHGTLTAPNCPPQQGALLAATSCILVSLVSEAGAPPQCPPCRDARVGARALQPWAGRALPMVSPRLLPSPTAWGLSVSPQRLLPGTCSQGPGPSQGTRGHREGPWACAPDAPWSPAALQGQGRGWLSSPLHP